MHRKIIFEEILEISKNQSSSAVCLWFWFETNAEERSRFVQTKKRSAKCRLLGDSAHKSSSVLLRNWRNSLSSLDLPSGLRNCRNSQRFKTISYILRFPELGFPQEKEEFCAFAQILKRFFFRHSCFAEKLDLTRQWGADNSRKYAKGNRQSRVRNNPKLCRVEQK